jgi:tetratricopeptide (TPR) repeat protein
MHREDRWHWDEVAVAKRGLSERVRNAAESAELLIGDGPDAALEAVLETLAVQAPVYVRSQVPDPAELTVAFELAEEIARHSQTPAEAFCRLAHLARLLEARAESERLYRAALTHGPSYEAHLGLARCRDQEGDSATALMHAESALRLIPADVAALLQRARSLADLGRGEEALDILADLVVIPGPTGDEACGRAEELLFPPGSSGQIRRLPTSEGAVLVLRMGGTRSEFAASDLRKVNEFVVERRAGAGDSWDFDDG